MAETNTPVSAGQVNGETYEERLKAWEKEKKGFISDLQKERAERHSLEERLGQLEQSLSSVGKQTDVSSPDNEVVRLSQDPRGYIRSLVSEVVEPIAKDVNQVRWERKFDQAYRWLGKQEKVDEEEVRGSALEENIARIIRENGMGTMDPIEGTRAAYKIYLQEKKEKEREERNREEAITGNSTESVKTPVRTGQMRFTRSQIASMPRSEFERNREAILEAQQQGLIGE